MMREGKESEFIGLILLLTAYGIKQYEPFNHFNNLIFYLVILVALLIFSLIGIKYYRKIKLELISPGSFYLESKINEALINQLFEAYDSGIIYRINDKKHLIELADIYSKEMVRDLYLAGVINLAYEGHHTGLEPKE